MAFVNSGPSIVATDGADDHLSMLVPGKDGRRADDAEVDIAEIVEDGAATRASSNDIYGRGWLDRTCLEPWVLVAANHDTRPIDVEEKDC